MPINVFWPEDSRDRCPFHKDEDEVDEDGAIFDPEAVANLAYIIYKVPDDPRMPQGRVSDII